jgi:hypothetical protein
MEEGEEGGGGGVEEGEAGRVVIDVVELICLSVPRPIFSMIYVQAWEVMVPAVFSPLWLSADTHSFNANVLSQQLSNSLSLSAPPRSYGMRRFC